MTDLTVFQNEIKLGNFSGLIGLITDRDPVCLEPEFFNFLKNHVDEIRNKTQPIELFKISEFCASKNYFELVYLLTDSDEWLIDLQRLRCTACRELGRIQEYFDLCKEVLTTSLLKKYFSKLPEFFNTHENYLKEKVFFKKAKLILLLETSQWGKAVDFVKNNSFENIYELLSTYESGDPAYRKLCLTQKLRESQRYEMMENELIEYLLLCETDIERMYLFELYSLNPMIELELLEIAKDILKLNFRDLPLEYRKLKTELKPNIQVKKVQPQNEDEVFPRLYSLENTNLGQIEVKDIRYEITPEEQIAITRLKFEDYEIEEKQELIKSFISMGFYSAALKLVESLRLSDEKLYYLGFLNLKISKFADAVFYINEYLNSVQPDDPIPFLKMKREAHMAMNNVDALAQVEMQLASLGEET